MLIGFQDCYSLIRGFLILKSLPKSEPPVSEPSLTFTRYLKTLKRYFTPQERSPVSELKVLKVTLSHRISRGRLNTQYKILVTNKRLEKPTPFPVSQLLPRRGRGGSQLCTVGHSKGLVIPLPYTSLSSVTISSGQTYKKKSFRVLSKLFDVSTHTLDLKHIKVSDMIFGVVSRID